MMLLLMNLQCTCVFGVFLFVCFFVTFCFVFYLLTDDDDDNDDDDDDDEPRHHVDC